MLLNSGADPKLETEEGFDASQMALNNHFPHIAKLIKSSKKKIKQETQISKTVNEAENISIFQSNNFIVPQSGSTPSHNSYNYNAPMDHSELGDEVSWALQMKKDLEEKKKNEETVKKRKNDESENDGDNKVSKTSSLKRKTQEEKLRELKAKIEEEEKRKSNPCQEEQMVNILEVMEKKRQRRMASKNKLTEKERLEKEQALVKQAMYDEIIWALQLQKDIAEQCGNIEDVEKYEKQILLEQEKKDGTHERRLKQKQKEEEEKIRQEKLAEERKKQEEIRKQEEIKRKKELAAIRAEEQRKMEIEFQRKKEQEAFERLPQWKKDKILREKNKDKDGSPTSMAIDQTKSNQDGKTKSDVESIDNLPKWKRDKILRDRQIAEEKARQEEQKRLELESIRESIRKQKAQKESLQQCALNGTEMPAMENIEDNAIMESESSENVIVNNVNNCEEEMECGEEIKFVDCNEEIENHQEEDDEYLMETQDEIFEDAEDSEYIVDDTDPHSLKETQIQEENRNQQEMRMKEEEEMKFRLEEESKQKAEDYRLKLEEEARVRTQELKLKEEARLKEAEYERTRLENEARSIAAEKEKMLLEEARFKAEEEKRQLEIELRATAEKEKLRKEEEKAKLKAEEEEKMKSYLLKVEERTRKRAEEANKKQEEERKVFLEREKLKEEERKRVYEEKQRVIDMKEAEEERCRKENEEQILRSQEDVIKKSTEESLKRIKEEEIREAEEKKRKKEKEDEEMRLYLLKVEERTRRRAEEANRKQEEERRKLMEIEHRREEEKRRKEEERLQLIEESRRRAEEERLRSEEEAMMRAEEERLRLEKEATIRAEELRLRKEARRRAEEIRLKEEARVKAEEDERIRLKEEAWRKAEEEEARRRAEEIRLKEEAKVKAEEDERIRVKEEAWRKAEEEEARERAEEIRLKEEARLKAEEDERIRLKEEAWCKAEEEEARKRAERIVFIEETRLKAEEDERIRLKEDAWRRAEEEERLSRNKLKALEGGEMRLEKEPLKLEEEENIVKCERHLSSVEEGLTSENEENESSLLADWKIEQNFKAEEDEWSQVEEENTEEGPMPLEAEAKSIKLSQDIISKADTETASAENENDFDKTQQIGNSERETMESNCCKEKEEDSCKAEKLHDENLQSNLLSNSIKADDDVDTDIIYCKEKAISINTEYEYDKVIELKNTEKDNICKLTSDDIMGFEQFIEDENEVQDNFVAPKAPTRKRRVLVHDESERNDLDSISFKSDGEENAHTDQKESNIRDLIQNAKENVVLDLNVEVAEDEDKERIKSKDQLDNFIAMIQSRLNEVKVLKEKRKKESEPPTKLAVDTDNDVGGSFGENNETNHNGELSNEVAEDLHENATLQKSIKSANSGNAFIMNESEKSCLEDEENEEICIGHENNKCKKIESEDIHDNSIDDLKPTTNSQDSKSCLVNVDENVNHENCLDTTWDHEISKSNYEPKDIQEEPIQTNFTLNDGPVVKDEQEKQIYDTTHYNGTLNGELQVTNNIAQQVVEIPYSNGTSSNKQEENNDEQIYIPPQNGTLESETEENDGLVEPQVKSDINGNGALNGELEEEKGPELQLNGLENSSKNSNEQLNTKSIEEKQMLDKLMELVQSKINMAKQRKLKENHV